ncbi:NACHT domain-containing protein [Longispora urticae]
MRREPPVTLRGALKILGHHDRPWLDRLNTLLGGAILAGGAVTMATGGLPALAAGGFLAAVWGWVDQKNEAFGVLRTGLDKLSDRLAGTGGYERHQLIAAAHTTIVLSAYFQCLREQLGKKQFRDLDLTDREKVTLGTNEWHAMNVSQVARLYESTVPAPSAACGFEENLTAVTAFLKSIDDRVHAFRHELAGSPGQDRWSSLGLMDRAVGRYRSHFLTLAATVPEFAIWAHLTEHAATRTTVVGLRAEVGAALTEHGGALARVENLLRLCGPARPAPTGALETLRRANRGVLDEPVIDADTARLDSGITFPEIGRSYVDPRYRLTRYQTGIQPADESQWEEWPVRGDVDLLVAGHVVSPDATRLPLLLLGHPGAGKSLLTKVLAARLPSASFTVVRVPLRRVGANAPVYRQIQEALDLVTHERVSWSDLAEQSAETVRVVLLDGLDELLQATNSDRTGYLREVAEFQRTEAVQDRPVIVLVTSRTVVADRVEIPAGTPIVRLEAFDDDQIRTWVAGWREANAAMVQSERLRPISTETALGLRHLARQPVLLLMLALYLADPQAPDLDSGLSEAGLLRQLLHEFAVREVRKKAPGRLVGEALEEQVAEQLRRLSVAALGMFNRGRQDIAEDELGADLVGLGIPVPVGLRADEIGQRVLGEFFFLHTAEATVPSEAAPGRVRRRYEFLHATFGEYLVAAHVVDTLADVADAALGGKRAREPRDELLFALLSNQPLAIQRPLLTFVGQLVWEHGDGDRSAMARTIEILISRYRTRRGSDEHAGYRPTEPDQVRQLAAYSANLVLLRLALMSGGGLPLAELWPEEPDPLGLWRSTVTLWRSGLDASGWRSMLTTVDLTGSEIWAVDNDGLPAVFDDGRFARLLGDRALGTRIRIGMAARDAAYTAPHPSGEDWFEDMVEFLFTDAMVDSREWPSGLTIFRPPTDVDIDDLDEITQLMCWSVRKSSSSWTFEKALAASVWLMEYGYRLALDPLALALLITQFPATLRQVPKLRDPRLYEGSAEASLLMFGASHAIEPEEPLLRTLIASLDGENSFPEMTADESAHLFRVIRRLQTPPSFLTR